MRVRVTDRDTLFDLLAGTSDGVFAVNRRQQIAFWNGAAPRILGFEPEAVLGRPCYEVLGGLDERGCAVCERRCVAFRTSMRGLLSPTRDVRALTKSGERKLINVTTFVLPSRWHQFSLLAHVFREANEAGPTWPRWEDVRRAARSEGGPIRPPTPLERLTRREAQILQLLASGVPTTTIGSRLDIKTTTVRTHVQHVLEKLGVHSRLEAVACATWNGWLRSALD